MSAFERQAVTVLELDLDTCQNTYGVLPCTASGPVGLECYNTFQTCQDKQNYIKTVKTGRFVTPGASVPTGESLRPYITDVAPVPTEIDLEKGLAPRGMVTVTLADPPDSDIEADPYAATRPAPAGGTFWPRLLARNKNYSGRFARLKTAYFTDGWDEAAFTTELYVIERIDPPDNQGRVKIGLKDPVKLADRRTVPEATDGKLLLALSGDPLALSLVLETGQGALYPTSGFVRIGAEVMEYTGKTGDTLTLSTFANRGVFGTAAEAHKAGEGVQLCKVWQGVRVHQVLTELYAASGIPAGNIDSAGFQAQDNDWLGGEFVVTACISEPERITKLISDLVVQTGAYSWWDATAQLVRFKVIAPRAPSEAPIIELTEVAHIVEDSVKVERLDDLRITVAGIWYDPKSATADRNKVVTYLRGEIFIDADAESANEYGDRRSDIALSRWFTAANAPAIKATVARRIGRYRDAPQRIHVTLDAKDADIKAGDLVDISVGQVVGVDGQPATVRTIVTRRKDEGGRTALRLRATNLGARYGFWAPAGTGDFPADAEYAHWAPSKTGFSDGSGPYLFF